MLGVQLMLVQICGGSFASLVGHECVQRSLNANHVHSSKLHKKDKNNHIVGGSSDKDLSVIIEELVQAKRG